MKRSLFFSSLAVASIGMLFISVAQAGDGPMEALKKAQKAQLDAPASRMKVITTDDNNKTSTVTISNPGMEIQAGVGSATTANGPSDKGTGTREFK